MDPERLYTPREIAKRTGLSADRIRAAARAGELKAHAFGSWFRIRGADFVAWRDRHVLTAPRLTREERARARAAERLRERMAAR